MHVVRAAAVTAALVALSTTLVPPVLAGSPDSRPGVGARGPADAAPAATGTPKRVDGRRVLTDDTVAPTDGLGRALRIRSWPGRTIRYRESIPSKWDWSLARAVEHWNASGSKIRFVEADRKHQARLTIRYGDTGGADGMATVGYTSRAFVHLSPTYKRADPFDPLTRVWVGRLFAHELGHVLGFGHTRPACSLMVPIFDLGTCPVLDDEPGYYACRWIDRPLLKRFVATYGGRAKRPSARCLIEALPPELDDVTIDGGGTQGPVSLRWRLSGPARPGTRLAVRAWAAKTCTDAPPRADTYLTGLSDGSWQDPGKGTGSWCYQLQPQNRYGATSGPVVRSAERWAPVPAPPDVSTATWHAAAFEHRLVWDAPAGTELVVMRSANDPLACPGAYDPDSADYAWKVSGDTWAIGAWAPRECVALYAVTSWGTVSSGVQVTLVVPPPTATPSVGTPAPDPDYDGAFRASISAVAPDSLVLGIEVRAGRCPAGPPDDAGWYDGWELASGVFQFFAEDAGTNCLLVAVVDGFGQPGPVVTREFTWSP